MQKMKTINYIKAITAIIRFRNWKYDTYPSTLTIPTDPPDCHSAGNPSLPSGQQNYATWAYEYWPGIVIQ